MAELGNEISKKIYEARVAEIIAKRATPNCDKETREKWIKAKYLLKAFINPNALQVVWQVFYISRFDYFIGFYVKSPKGNENTWSGNFINILSFRFYMNSK